MSKGKWFVRLGSLLVVVGFFLPSLPVSFSTISSPESISLAMIATKHDQVQVYALLIGVLVAGGISFFASRSQQHFRLFYMVQLIALLLGAAFLLTSLITLQRLIYPGDWSLKMLSHYGAFVQLGGLMLFSAGWIWQWVEGGRLAAVGAMPPPLPPSILRTVQFTNDASVASPEQKPIQHQAGGTATIVAARLEVIEGSLADRSILITHDNFTLGRSEQCDLQLADRKISRLHARFRIYQGIWYIQDQQSKLGIYVNSKKVDAARLIVGDHLAIGPYHFLFFCD
jgi:hypothetical protein